MNNDYEIIDLASEGWFYKKDHPLSCGKVKLKPLCFKVEKLLCSNNLKKKGVLDNFFLENVLEVPIKTSEILFCDYQTVLLNTRILNYGSVAKYKITCPHCGVESEQEIKFSFRGKQPPSPKEIGENRIDYRLSNGKIIGLKIPTWDEYIKLAEISWLDFLKILLIDANASELIDSGELSVKDSRNLRTLFKESYPGFDTVINLTCPSCFELFKTNVDVSLDIFGYSPEYKKSIQEEMFSLAYHSNGAFSLSEVEDLSISDRTFYINQLITTKNKENEAEKKAMNSKGGSKTISPPPRVKK